MLSWGWLLAAPAWAENAELTALRVEHSDEGLFLTARVDFTLSPVVEDALHKGIPVHFVAEADVLRERWYWYDRNVASAQRYMRVAYQPLTRRWRRARRPRWRRRNCCARRSPCWKPPSA